MKKICGFALILMSMLSCIVFSACGDKYADLNMEFFSNQGTKIDALELVIDQNDKTSSKREAQIGVKFSGIDEEDIGQVVVYSSPLELVTVSDYSYSNDMCYVNVKANMASENAKLIVSHLSSNKTASIDLKIQQKSTGLNLLNDKYIISIPQNEGEINTHYLDIQSLVSLTPAGSTDKVFFNYTGSDLSGIKAITDEETGFIKGFEVEYGATPQSITVYPVTTLVGFDDKEYTNKPITIEFAKTISLVSLKSDDDHKLEEAIYLISNDNSKGVGNYCYNNFIVSVENFSEYSKFYNIAVSSSSSEIIASIISENQILIQANAYTEDVETVTISCVPKDYVGDIKAVSTEIKVKGEVKSDSIEVKKANVVQETNNIDIYDYYTSGNSLGALFNFKAVSNSGIGVYKDLSKTVIKIDPRILYSNHNVYTDDDFKTLSTRNEWEFNDSTIELSSQKYQLEIYKFNDLLKFYYDNGMMLSEPFNDSSNIYIKYSETVKTEDNVSLRIQVETINESTLPYLEGIKSTARELSFERKIGVQSALVQAGEYISETGNARFNYFNDQATDVTTIYLDNTKGVDNEAVHQSVLKVHTLFGVKNEAIKGSVELQVEVIPITVSSNNLKLKAGGEIEYDEANKTFDGSAKFPFVYSPLATEEIKNNLFIGFSAETEVGEYQIKLSQPDTGFEKIITAYVYQSLKAEDVQANFAKSNTAFKNFTLTEQEGEIVKSYTFAGYEVDYIVASKQQIDLEVNVPDSVINSNILTGYVYSFIIDNVADENKLEYFAVLENDKYKDGHVAVMNFKKGTYVDGNKYVTLTATVKTKQYSNIITQIEDAETEISLTFFIYEKIESSNISINHSNSIRYMNECLGIYNQDESKLKLEISMYDNDLWNYVQSQNQDEDKFKIGISNADGYKTSWNTGDGSSISTLENGQTDNSLSLQFNKSSDDSSYSRTINAVIKQFNEIFTLKCEVTVKKPIISEKVILTSEINFKTEGNEDKYAINLKKGETYKVEASNYSTEGVVSHPGIVIQVVTKTFNANQEYVSINPNTNEITVNEVVAGMKLIIFAKDALSVQPTSDIVGYGTPSSFLLTTDENRHRNAYLMIDLDLSDGKTKETAYQIYGGDDFWEINDSDESKTAYYALMNNVNISNTTYSGTKAINNFTGTIFSYGHAVYTLYGISLNNSNPNLFVDLGIREDEESTLENVRFEVAYNYEYTGTLTKDINLGLIDVNNGTLTNVFVEISGGGTFNSTAKNYYFGGLVGENCGKIIFENTTLENYIGTNGEITLIGSGNLLFGGVSGKNLGLIDGFDVDIAGGADISVGLQNVVANLTITATDISASNSAIGQVVGLNTSEIKDIYATGTIEGSNNLGGVIGKNEFDLTSIIVTLTDDAVSNISDIEYKIQNIVSSVKVDGTGNNVGGIVGYDQNGTYKNVQYQILPIASGVRGGNNVGGIAGYSQNGKFKYCAVYSYVWDYSNLENTFDGVADISGSQYAGGLIGYADGSTATLNAGENVLNDKVIVSNSSVNAKVKAENNIGGLLTSSEGKISVAYNVYFIGMLDCEFITYETVDATQKLCLDNANKVKNNVAYTINVDNSALVKGSAKDGKAFDITFTNPLTYETETGWGWDSDLNGAYIYVIKDGEDNFFYKPYAVDESTFNEHKDKLFVYDSEIYSSAESLTYDSTKTYYIKVYLPIFDIAPTKIDVTVNGEGVKNEENEKINDLINLYYYDFNSSTTNNAILTALNAKYNTYNLTGENGLFSITVEPQGITARLSILSSNSRVARVTNEGKLIVEGVGQCVLTFASILNPNVYDEIIVNVSAPIGDEDKFIVSESEADENEKVGTLKVAKDSSKQLFIISSGEKRYPDVDGGSYYSYATAQNVKLKVVVSIETDKLGGKTISDYISISGIAGDETNDGTTSTLIVYLDETTPLSIGVNQYLPNKDENKFAISVMPYETISCSVSLKDESKKFESTKLNLLTNHYEFNLQTAVGPTEISANITSAVVYPNDVTTLRLRVKTDIVLSSTDITALLKLLELDNAKIDDANYDKFIKCFKHSYDNTTQIHTIEYDVQFREEDVAESGKSTLKATFAIPNGEYAKVEYTLLKQRINKIEIKNYEIDGTELQLSDILKPAKEDKTNGGRLIIDMAPDNGYYDYLEIRDITGNEEIKFVQLNGALGSNLSALDEVTADGKGIKLVKVKKADGSYDLRTYVSTQISKDYSSKIHTVEVRAYLSDGTLLTSDVYYVDVKMLPSITVEYQLPDGSVGLTAENSSVSDYLAEGTSAQFRVTGSNFNSEIETSVSGDNASNYELVDDGGGFYILKLKENKAATLGETVKVTFKVYSVADNGDYEETEASIAFTIVKFVIHSVSVVDANKDEIYGNTGTTKELEFYFSGTDVSFSGVDREGSYRYCDEFWNDSTGLKTILTNLNTNPNDYLKLHINEKDSDNNEINSWDADENGDGTNEITYTLAKDADTKISTLSKTGSASSIIILNDKNLMVQEETTSIKRTKDSQTFTQPIYLAVDMILNLEKDENAYIWKTDEPIVTGGTQQFTKNFRLNFNDATSLFKPKLVKDAEDFLAMNSGENNHYILGNDITLKDYSPIDVDIASFDGNGRIITIESFASFDEETINAGLFKKIYEGMLVKNVNIVFKSTYLQETGEWSFGQTDNGLTFADLCNNSTINYTQAIFGGLTPLNEGIVTNCTVSGTIALRASTVEEKKTSTGGNYSINFTIGGLIGENTGYVTHSDSSLNIYSQANIGGFVYRNEGHISSCEYNEGEIYTYNNNLDKTIVVKVAGFVVENAGEISMSDVELTSKTMSVKDVSAGFVYENSGEIEDCYVNILKTGTNNNTFCGFVFQNGGTISTSYTCINNGNKENNNDYMFAPTSSTGIYNCIEINNSGDNSGYSSGVEGLKSLVGSKRTVRSEYEKYGFTFGDNKTAIWTISLSLPKLVSVQDKVRYTLDEDPTGDSVYYGLQNIYKQAVEGEENTYEYITNPGNYGSKSNPYVIYDLMTWNFYFEDNTNKYFRIVADIDFGSIGDNPLTSIRTFKGNIQGNNMKLTNILLKSSSSLNSIGLFKEFVSANNVGIENSVRNLTLSVSSVWATKTSSVGVLVGISENFNLYNLHIDSAGKTIVGGNAVGGVAGVVRGKFNMQKISSNVGVNSTVATDRYKYAIYISKNNKRYEDASFNLKDVYYAGSVVGILDAYDSTVYDFEAERDISTGYFDVKDITVSGSIVAIGDSVGGAFGFVGERVKLQNVSVNLTDSLLSGGQYSAGIAGENRGVIDNATVTIEGDSTFNDSIYVSAGIVGLNLGGLVQNVNATCKILKSGRQTVVAGIAGRNMNGNVNNATFTGKLSAGFVGGIVGGDYSNRTVFKGSPSGSGALRGSYLDDAIPENQIVYAGITNYQNLTISKQTLDHFFENIKKYYTFKSATSFESAINRYYVYGLCVGLSDNMGNVIVQTYGLDDDKTLVFNGSKTHNGIGALAVKVENSLLVSATQEEVDNEEIKTFDLPYGNVIKGYEIPESVGSDVLVAYAVGAYVSTFDTWDRTAYGNDMMIFTNS